MEISWMDRGKIKDYAKRASRYIITFLRWFIYSVVIALVCGIAGCFFHLLIEQAAWLRGKYDFIIYFLPVGGVVIVAIYHLFRLDNISGTNHVMDSTRGDGKVPFALAPGIIISTVITHLLGGSAGREGAALQLGGSLGSALGKLFRLDRDDMHIIVLCGMSAVFTALFGTPLTAVVFVIEVISVGTIYYSAIMPCIFSSVFTYLITVYFDMTPISHYIETVPEISALGLAQTVGLAILFALVSILWCVSLSKGSALFKKIIKNPYLRIIAGGTALIVLTLIFGTDYNGAGMGIVENAVVNGMARPEAFVIKILFTVITLGCGYKGGEIVPTFFVGATFGCVMAPLVGMDAGFGAALGLVGVFCGATNAPIASLFLGIELFGTRGLPYFAVVCAVSYMLSGYFSLYKSQIIVFDKLKAVFINRKTQ